MAGGVGSGPAVQPASPGSARSGRAQGEPANGPAEFASLLGQAETTEPAAAPPAASEDPPEASGEPGNGIVAWPAPVEPPATTHALAHGEGLQSGDGTLAARMLALIGIDLSGTAAPAPDPAPPLPAVGGMQPRAGEGAPGTLVLPGLAQPAALEGALPAVPGLPMQAQSGGDPAAQPFAALEALEGAGLEAAGRDTASNPAATLAATQPRASAPSLPAALAAPLPMPADPDGGFDDGLGARIGWMAGQQLGRAEIRLNPEQLGVVDIRLDLDGSRVSVELSSANQEVRQALEASLVRLREMLAGQGLELARADVGSGHGGGSGQSAPSSGTPGDGGQGVPGDRADAEAVVTVRRQGLLDEYA